MPHLKIAHRFKLCAKSSFESLENKVYQRVNEMKVAVEGCAHGELEKIYDTIAFIEEQESIKVDLLLCCGDFQATRNLNDLECMAVPKKFRDICTFYK